MSNATLVTFLFELANFVVLAAVLAWLFFNPIRKLLDDQRDKTRSQKEAAAQALSEAESIRAEIAAERSGLAHELEQMRKKALELAKGEASALIDEARKQMEREREVLRRESADIQRAQAVKTAHSIAAAAEQVVSRLLRQLSGPELRHMLIAAACNQLASFGNNSLEAVTIESARELSPDEHTRIESALGRDKKKADYRVVPSLGGGLRISTAAGLIDTSISGLARFAEEALSAELERSIRDELDRTQPQEDELNVS